VTSPETLLARVRASVLTTGRSEPPPPGERPASVLLLLDPASERLPLLFTLRSRELRQHAGQIAFPGGSADSDDRDPVATGLREAHEEIGLAPDNVDVIGLLPAMSTRVSGVWLTPVVGLQRAPFDVVTDPAEVASWFRVDLATLMTAPHEVRVLEHGGMLHNVHFYEADGRTIWGVTGAVLHDFLARVGRSD
jgi:8-oxo-dGTP pyrophosphatase MutT (NUDIX family)